MSHHVVRYFFCALLLAVLAVLVPHHRPLVAAAPSVDQPRLAPPLTRTHLLDGAPALRSWPTAEAVFYRHGQTAYRQEHSFSYAPYLDQAFELEMQRLRPALLTSAARHNRPELTGMSDEEFAVVMAAQIYFECNAVLADRSTVGRLVTPIYQDAQVVANSLGMGNFSVWPTNLRPSVALSLLRGEMPYIDINDEPAYELRPIVITGSKLQPAMARWSDWEPSLSAVAAEIADPELAIEYLAANFEIASYRAAFDWTPVSWITFAAWHNQGLVGPDLIAFNPQLQRVLPAIEGYLPVAQRLIYLPPDAPYRGAPIAD